VELPLYNAGRRIGNYFRIPTAYTTALLPSQRAVARVPISRPVYSYVEAQRDKRKKTHCRARSWNNKPTKLLARNNISGPIPANSKSMRGGSSCGQSYSFGTLLHLTRRLHGFVSGSSFPQVQKKNLPNSLQVEPRLDRRFRSGTWGEGFRGSSPTLSPGVIDPNTTNKF